MSKKYTVVYFIKKFKAIPLRLWIRGTYNAGGEACCALGHCGARLGRPTEESRALVSVFKKLSSRFTPFDNTVGGVNDYVTDKYPQKTPRGRILAALKSIKAS